MKVSQDYRLRRRTTLALCAVVFTGAAPAADDAAKVARLALEVQRAEDIRAVKKLQISYAQYLQFGLWSQMASLCSDDAEVIHGGDGGGDELKGRATIEKYFLTNWGDGREGLPAGGLHTLLEDT